MHILETDTANGYKICRKCQEKKDLNQFYWDNRFNIYYARCKYCDYLKTKEYKEKNRLKVRKRDTEYVAHRYKTNSEFKIKVAKNKKRYHNKNKLSAVISGGIGESLRGNKKGRHWEFLVGYTLADVKSHLESKFQDGMTWENQGEWEIDHILPKNLFTFNSPEDTQFKLCWALNNLQPLWGKDNVLKQDLLPNGKYARTMTETEKTNYLKELNLL